MNQFRESQEWGPSHDQRPGGNGWKLMLLWLAFMLAYGATGSGLWTLVILGGTVLAGRVAISWRAQTVKRSRTASRLASARDKFAAVQNESARRGGVYLGTGPTGDWVTARPERAVLLLGPPRSGKTSGVIVPAVLAHPGPVVSASTKPDVLAATGRCRTRLGTVWQFDPTGTSATSGARQLRWSPVTGSRSWDGALMIARSMVTGTGVGTGTTDQSHWSRRAQALLAPMLHAAAIDGRNIEDVVEWVLSHELDQPGILLHNADAVPAVRVLAGLANTEARERSSIFSAAADALDAYTSTGALAAATDPNFDPVSFARSWDTIYIHAPAEHQALAAPLVCGLLAEIRAATYRVARDLTSPARMLFALDEVANIAPLAELPQIASEGGGQNLTLLAAFQDLSQARARWGTAANGFLTLFGTKLILPGVADTRTLEAISVAIGEYDRQVISTTHTQPSQSWVGNRSDTISTQRQRLLPPGEIANIPAGHALCLDGLDWQLVTLTAAHRDEPWRALTQPPAPVQDNAGELVLGTPR
jgi:type IV secretion system protein VirD4